MVSTHKCKIIVIFLLLAVFFIFWIIKAGFQYYTDQTRYSGTIIGQYLKTVHPSFILQNPNNPKEKVDIVLTMFFQEEDRVISPVLVSEGLYFILTKWYEEEPPRIMFLNENSLKEINIKWPENISDFYVKKIYVYDQKIYLALLAKNYGIPDRIYVVSKTGGIAREVCDNVDLHSHGDSSAQMDGVPIQYRDGLICYSWDDPSIEFVNEEREEKLFSLPVGTAMLMKGWYEEGKSLLLWSENPNYGIVVDLKGEVLFEIYRSLFWGTSSWDVYGNVDNAILLKSMSIRDYDYVPGIDKLYFLRRENIKHFDSGIYDVSTGNMIPLHWKNIISPKGWAKVDYDKEYFDSLSNSAKAEIR